MNRISMDQISFAVALKHSYSDYKFNVSTVSSKMVGTYTTFKTPPVQKFSGSRARAAPSSYLWAESYGQTMADPF